MNKLNVFYEDILVGTLIRNSDLVYSFAYSEKWLTFENAFQLSLAMPLQEEQFGNKITLSFFENLLPEGEARDVLEKGHQVKGPFDLLREFGSDCAGAVIICPENESPTKLIGKGEIKIEMKQIFDAIDEKRSVAEVVSNLEHGYLSIAGAQDKFAATYRGGEFFLPTQGLPTTHIVKVPIYRSGVKQSVYNEYYCMRLAQLVGLNVSKCLVLDDEKHPLYITQRYDRVKEDVIKRIHQQDFCQALGVVSEDKYESRGGPTLLDNYNLIKSNVTIKLRSKALFHYLDWICFNLLIGNNDSHSKNISFLLNKGKIELAPFYDLLCTAIYPKLKKEFSFMIGDRTDSSKIGRNQLEMVDKNLGLKLGTMSERILLMSDNIFEHKDKLADEIKLEFPNAKIVKRISDLIEKRCTSLKRQGL